MSGLSPAPHHLPGSIYSGLSAAPRCQFFFEPNEYGRKDLAVMRHQFSGHPKRAFDALYADIFAHDFTARADLTAARSDGVPSPRASLVWYGQYGLPEIGAAPQTNISAARGRPRSGQRGQRQ